MKKPAVKSKTRRVKPLFSMGLERKEREALEKAAKAEDRPAAYVARRALVEWLKANGWLK